MIRSANQERDGSKPGIFVLMPCGRRRRPAIETEQTMPEAINLAEKLALFDERWSPRIVGHFNGHEVMVVKLEGEFPWHSHAETDDFFLVLQGRIRIETAQGDVELGPGELYVVPRGVLHRPVAETEAHVLLIETAGTPNTGDPATAAIKVEL
jgi:mannose-6-phosphate isomerase-like protein (cupin superfamily)